MDNVLLNEVTTAIVPVLLTVLTLVIGAVGRYVVKWLDRAAESQLVSTATTALYDYTHLLRTAVKGAEQWLNNETGNVKYEVVDKMARDIEYQLGISLDDNTRKLIIEGVVGELRDALQEIRTSASGHAEAISGGFHRAQPQIQPMPDPNL